MQKFLACVTIFTVMRNKSGINTDDMQVVENVRLDGERALYGRENVIVRGVSFDGPADGESALKECRNVVVEDCFCNLRYPFWHDRGLKISGTEMTGLCRAAIWYSEDAEIKNSKLYGIKALRECARVKLIDCDILSPEFGWSTKKIDMTDCRAVSEYFMLRASDLKFKGVNFSGKYSFQYVENAVLEDCEFDTKDAFWHSKNVTVRNSAVKGEYLGWYSENLTFENCTIEGTQPLCYCIGLKLINCKLSNADLCFEKSEVTARITTPVISIKNPYGGTITLPAVGEVIRDDPNSKAKIIIL